jgi:hypothetical protein
VIAHCTSCGTHYKHDAPKERVRARCGRCDAELDLRPLSPYRIVSMPHAQATGSPAPGGSAVLAAGADQLWRDEDRLLKSPEMTPSAENSVLLQDGTGAVSGTEASLGGSPATIALWMAAGAIVGTALAWTMDGGTATGILAGSALGALAGWGWLRWTSPK